MTDTEYDYDVALSLAGEDREYVDRKESKYCVMFLSSLCAKKNRDSWCQATVGYLNGGTRAPEEVAHSIVRKIGAETELDEMPGSNPDGASISHM